MAANNAWGAEVGPLDLGPNLDPLPKGGRDIISKFSGDGKKSIDEHLNYFYTVCGVLDIPTKNVAIKLCVQTVTKVVADWLHHLPNGEIIDWASIIFFLK